MKTTVPFSASASGKSWDEEDWENDWENRMMGGHRYGGGYNNKDWTDPLKTPMTASTTRVAVNTGTGISASSIKIVKPKCTINSIAFKSVVDAAGTTVHTRREAVSESAAEKIAESRTEIVNGVQTTTHYNAKGVILNTEVKTVGDMVKHALNHLPVPAGTDDKYVKITPADIVNMDDEEIWDWVVNYPDEAAEYLIELKEGMY